jgi:transposase InsO family protein
LKEGKAQCFSIDDQGVLFFGKHIVVPKDHNLRHLILDEAHSSQFSIHPGTKMYQDLKQRFWWTRMKQEMDRYVAECDVCQRVKAEHLKPGSTLQPLPIPSWKWENIRMDFFTGLSSSSQGYDSIWLIVDRLTKLAHFFSVKTTYQTKQYAKLYLTRIVCLHGVPKTIVSDRGPQFIAHFWKSFREAMETDLIYSTAYHPQTDGQTERVNQVLEDMLRVCVLIYEKKGVSCLPFTEFSYYQASIKMSPFDQLVRIQGKAFLWTRFGEECRGPSQDNS